MIRPLLENNPCFWARPMIRTFLAILRFFLLRIINFSLDWFLIEKKRNRIFLGTISLKIYDFTYLFSVFTCYLNDWWLFWTFWRKKRPSVWLVIQFLSVVFQLWISINTNIFFSFCNFKNEEFHTFASSYDLTKQ